VKNLCIGAPFQDGRPDWLYDLNTSGIQRLLAESYHLRHRDVLFFQISQLNQRTLAGMLMFVQRYRLELRITGLAHLWPSVSCTVAIFRPEDSSQYEEWRKAARNTDIAIPDGGAQ
jgi:hypothetical protein